MTDPDERLINRAIAWLPDHLQGPREDARAALHRIFRKTRRMENLIVDLKQELSRYEDQYAQCNADRERLLAELDSYGPFGDGWHASEDVEEIRRLKKFEDEHCETRDHIKGFCSCGQ